VTHLRAADGTVPCDPEQVVGVAEHAPALDHLVQLGDTRLERFHRRRPVAHLHRHVDENLEAAIDRGRIDDGPVPDDDARVFQPAHPPQARRGAEPNPVRELDVGETAILLELPQNCSINV
jgi:hypothetical protein